MSSEKKYSQSLFGAWKLHRTVCLLCLLVTMPVANLVGAQQNNDLVKAAFIEKLTRFIEWPESMAAAGSKTFHLCVVGDGKILDPIHQLATVAQIKKLPIIVRKLNKPQQIQHCELVYLATSRRTVVEEVLSATKFKPILTMGDAAGLAEQGIMINFFETDNRLRFEINIDAARQSGFVISSRLLKVAKIIDEEDRR